MSVHAFVENPVTVSLLIISLFIFLAGVFLKITWWGHGSSFDFLSNWKREAFLEGWKVFLKTLVLDVFLIYRIWKQSKRRWIMHSIMFWGFFLLCGCLILSLTASVLVYIDPEGYGQFFAQYLKDLHIPYDLLGYVLLAGSLYALGRRLFIRKIRERSRLSDYILICMVLAIVCSGMIAELLSGYATFVGKAILNWDLALAWMDFHIYVALLLFLMILPWSKFKHIFTVPLTLLARRGGE